MKVETLKPLLDAKSGAVEEYPFGPDTIVYKIGGKIFAMVGTESDPLRISLKCDPDEAEALRAAFPAIGPGYCLNKRHWNTVTLDGSRPGDLLQEMIDASHTLVVNSLPKAEREQYRLERLNVAPEPHAEGSGDTR